VGRPESFTHLDRLLKGGYHRGSSRCGLRASLEWIGQCRPRAEQFIQRLIFGYGGARTGFYAAGKPELCSLARCRCPMWGKLSRIQPVGLQRWSMKKQRTTLNYQYQRQELFPSLDSMLRLTLHDLGEKCGPRRCGGASLCHTCMGCNLSQGRTPRC
jgi:hypothetical protein